MATSGKSIESLPANEIVCAGGAKAGRTVIYSCRNALRWQIVRHPGFEWTGIIWKA